MKHEKAAEKCRKMKQEKRLLSMGHVTAFSYSCAAFWKYPISLPLSFPGIHQIKEKAGVGHLHIGIQPEEADAEAEDT